MESVHYIIYTILIIIAIGSFFLGRYIFSLKINSTISQSKEKEELLKLQFSEWKIENEKIKVKLEENILNLTIEKDSFKEKLINKEALYLSLNEKYAEKKEELEKLNEKLQKEFENLASKILEEKSEKFTLQNKQNLEIILNPLKEKIKDFEGKIETSHKESISHNAGLRQQIEDLSKLNEKINTEAKNLTKALKGDNRVQGKWGELVLSNILDRSGLTKNQEYFVQTNYISEGNRLRPDVIIQLPDKKQIIIDSKASLTEYERFFSSESDEEKILHLKGHLESIKSHIKSLSDKKYQNIEGITSLDFIILFTPIEGALSLAYQQDNELFNFAFDRNIILASPTNLIAMLKTIAGIWNRERQNQNVEEIARKAADIYDKFVLILDDFKKLGNQLQSVQTTYSSSMKRISEGKGNLVKRVEDLKKLGVTPTKQIEQKWLDKSTDLDDLEDLDMNIEEK